MKISTRLILTAVLIAIWGFINQGLFYTVDVVAKNTLVVNTVNGGDAALAAQNAYNAGGNGFVWIISIIVAIIIGIIWYAPIKRLVNGADTFSK